jgi:hypothetical protein
MEKSRKSLQEKGWMFQLVVDRPSAANAEEVYNLLGFEVLRLPLEKRRPKKSISHSPGNVPAHFEVLYIRPKKFTESEEDDWT